MRWPSEISTLNVFAYATNVDMGSRIISFDLYLYEVGE